jgi:hypothetical protein
MTGKNAEEKEVPIKAYLYNKKKRKDEFRKTGHDGREDHVNELMRRIQDNFHAILDRRSPRRRS